MTGMSLERILIGNSSVMCHLRALIVKVAPTALPVLVQGPTGAGKELVAEALHLASGRPGAFVPFNVCAIADSMFEDTLFGHVRGAFTGALGDAPGYLAEADRGTLFLDEIGGLATTSQSKLLRALETGQFRPVGGRADRRSDFRLVAATNDDLARLTASGRFRADLAHRLGGLVLHVPTLARRLEDVPLLARHFLAQANSCGHAEITESGLRTLQAHSWPGNVRELKHVVECARALATRPRLGASEIRYVLGARAGTTRESRRSSFLERRLVEILEQVGWDVSAAARTLGVHRATIYRQLQRLEQSRGNVPRTRSIGSPARGRADSGTSRAPNRDASDAGLFN